MARPGTLYIAAATVAVLITQGTAEYQCYDNTAANCGGNVVTNVSTRQDCCLGKGYWFQDPEHRKCEQCNGTAKFQCYDNTAANCGGNEVTGVNTRQHCCKEDGYWFWDPKLGDCLQCIGTEQFQECYGSDAADCGGNVISEYQCYDNTAANCGGNVISGMSTRQDCCNGNGYWFQDRASGDCEQCSGTAEYQCYDNTAANCGGNVISGVSTHQDCCNGNGYWFQHIEFGGCEQCNATVPIVQPTRIPIQVNETVPGNPLMVVPLNLGDSTRIESGLSEGDHMSLCYEVHGEANENFNLVSDVCVSVNAHYMMISSDVDINIIDTIGVRAVGNDNQCRNIQVDLDGCRASVDGVEITMPYRRAGISVRKYTNRVRIAVPNCDDHDLVMWVFCQNGTFSYNDTSTFQSPMIQFVIARGFNLLETSHGILGQFWNIPIDVVPFNQTIEGTVRSDTYTITVNYTGQTRQFVGFLYPLTWEFDERQCLYVGNWQGGPIDEIDDPNDPVLQGEYTDYIVDDLFSTDFAFAHFETSRCPASIPPTKPPPTTPPPTTPPASTPVPNYLAYHI